MRGQQPENYVDSKEYASWEWFFTTILVSKTENDPVWAYSKKRLPKAYLSSKVVSAVKKITKLIEWD